jgi:hypothetical protein
VCGFDGLIFFLCGCIYKNSSVLTIIDGVQMHNVYLINVWIERKFFIFWYKIIFHSLNKIMIHHNFIVYNIHDHFKIFNQVANYPMLEALFAHRIVWKSYSILERIVTDGKIRKWKYGPISKKQRTWAMTWGSVRD